MLIIYLHFDFFLKKKKYDTNGNLVRKKKRPVFIARGDSFNTME